MGIHAPTLAAPFVAVGGGEPAVEQPYLDLLADVLQGGEVRADRTGVGTRGVFGRQMRFDLARGFPLLTTKRVHFKSVVTELLWFLRGETNIAWLKANGCSIWDEWADAEGDLGPVYGRQWRSWAAPDGQVIDQIAKLVSGIRQNPFGRRHIVSAWNPADVDDMALPPCHCLFQFHVSADGRLSCQLYQRSADIFLGVPFNIASYALLTHMIAQVTGLRVGAFVHSFGDLHLYLNHTEQAELQLSRDPLAAPRLVMQPRATLEAFEIGDFALEGYAPHGRIPAPVAV